MKIGIDAGVLREKTRGVGRYLANILERLPKLITNDQIYLYSPRPILYQYRNSANWYYRYGTTLLPGSFWLQTQCKSYLKKDKIETFFGPSHVLPLNLPNTIRKVLAVNDLVSVLYPKTMASYNLFIHKLFFRQSIISADHIVTMSEYTKNAIVRYFGIDKEKITIIYGGVNDKFRPYNKDEVFPIISQYGLKRPYFLSVGTLEPRKNYEVLLQAFKQLKVDYDLVIIGKKGWKASNIFMITNSLRLQDRVKILGYVKEDDLPLLYNGAEVFMFPSLYEGFGLPVLEALACGIPTISSNASSLPEIGGEAVKYFNPNSIDDLLKKMQEVLDSNELRKSLREKGVIQAKKFNWDKTSQKTLAVLKGLAID